YCARIFAGARKPLSGDTLPEMCDDEPLNHNS
ncbi:unnamed protein product, partial [marine sediment metagenome]